MRACCAVPRLSCLASRALGEALARSGGGWVERREQLVRSVQHVGEDGAADQLRLHYFLAALQGERQREGPPSPLLGLPLTAPVRTCGMQPR